MTLPQIHPDIAHLETFVGMWEGRGSGHYPTIEPFEYLEWLTVGHVGKPFLSVSQRTKRHGEPGEPLHAEAAYIRPGGPAIEMILVQPSGITELHASGTLLTDGPVTILRFHTLDVHLTPTAKSVTEVVREYRVVADTMSYDISMAAVGQPLQHHLSAELHRTV